MNNNFIAAFLYSRTFPSVPTDIFIYLSRERFKFERQQIFTMEPIPCIEYTKLEIKGEHIRNLKEDTNSLNNNKDDNHR